jgi:hypothetical protein
MVAVPIVLLEESLERSDNCAGYRSVLGLSRLSVTRLRLVAGFAHVGQIYQAVMSICFGSMFKIMQLRAVYLLPLASLLPIPIVM